MKISNLAVCFLAGSFIAEPVSAFQRELPGAATLLADEIAVGGKHQLAVVDFTDLQGNV